MSQHLEIWIDGRPVSNDNDAVLVAVNGEYAELAATLTDMEAIMKYVKSQFPNGWTIEDGCVISSEP